MRDIKFRAWDKKDKTMGMVFDLFTEPIIGTVGAFDRDTIILMQYTGLKDKNGKEIYEGDIVRYTCKENSKEKYTNKVYFDKEGFWSPLISVFPEDPDMQDEYFFEVVGNIHENPELLNK